MLPGFRILLALVVLSFAILIFGFGALALLRTAHHNLASQPTWQPAWRTPVEIANAQRDDRRQLSSETQTLALLRADPPEPRPEFGTKRLSVLLAPATDAPPVQERHGDATPGNAETEVTSPQSTETPPLAAANNDDRPIPPARPEPVAGAGDETSAQTTTSPPGDEAPKPSASNASAAPEAQGASSSGQVAASEPLAPDLDATAPGAKAAEAASETKRGDPAAPKSEPPIELAALPDASTSSVEGGQQTQQQIVKKPDAAELRARRRARARLRARRLALARERAARLAQQQQAAANSAFYGSNFSTTQNATNSTPNATPFNPPRGAP
jgi:hypothetical protein